MSARFKRIARLGSLITLGVVAIGNDQMRDVDGIERSTDDSYAHGCVFVLKETTTRMLPSRPFRQLIHRYSGGALHTRERLEAAHQAR